MDSIHTSQARRQRGHDLEQFGTLYAESDQCRPARDINTMHGEHSLGEIDTNSAMDFFHRTKELMKDCTSHRATYVPYTAIMLITWDGNVPFIR
jgi:hypothetical protein